LARAVSSFVVHGLRIPEGRRQVMREIAGVLKPGGHVALAGFIFTSEWENVRRRDSPFSFRTPAILNFDAVKTHPVVGNKS